MSLLWADVPRHQQFSSRDPGRMWRGCQYAVSVTTVFDAHGYLRCAIQAKYGADHCYLHDPNRSPQDLEIALMSRAREAVKRGGMRYSTDPIGWLRSRSDDDIDAMRNVGVKVGARIKEIRDTWDDDQVREFFQLEPPPDPPKIDPQVFWTARPEVLSVMGG